MNAVVLDTNIVLDLFVFDDAASQALREALQTGELAWLATAAMREELARVLAYARIEPRLAVRALSAEAVLAHFDRHARLVEPAPKACVSCQDPDDQHFIDLAVTHRARLFSKDRAVLRLKRRLERLGVATTARLDTSA